MKKLHLTAVKAAVLVICIGVTALLTARDVHERGIDDSHFMYAEVNGVKISIHEIDGQYCLFLPSFADESKIRYSYEARQHEIKVYKSANLPSIFITTNSGTLNNILADKENRESGKITVFDEKGALDSSRGLKYIKGRGNYSWNNWDKKSFKVKLKKDASVLDLGMGKDYCLIANASDGTLIRNEIGRRLEMAVGIPYAAAGRFADLYINGDYMGNYYMCASIEVGPGRVDITDMDQHRERLLRKINSNAISVYETPELRGWNLPETMEDITGGYLLEREFGDRYDLEYGSFNNGFVTSGGEHYIVLSPDYCTVREINYIRDFMEEVEDEIFSGDGSLEHVDTGSFARRYLVEEVLKNYDGGVSSAYYYKDRDMIDTRIFAGPGWDFDMSLGNYLDWMEYADEDATGITKLYLSEHSSTYYRELVGDPEFMTLTRESFFKSVCPYLKNLCNTGIYNYEKQLSASAAMDSVRWKDMYEAKGYTTSDHSEYEKLRDFILMRMEFLEGEWSD